MRRIFLCVCLGVVAVGLSPQRAQSCWPCYAPACCYPCYAPAYHCGYPGYYYGYPTYSWNWYGTAVSPRPVVVADAAAPTTTLTVTAPSGVAVYVEGVRVPLQDGQLTFNVPGVREGRRYVYHFRAESEQDGQTVSTRREVAFQPGERVRVAFTRADLDAVSRK